LWLRYRPLERAAQQRVQAQARSIVLPGAPSPTTDAALAELNKGLSGMLGRAPANTTRHQRRRPAACHAGPPAGAGQRLAAAQRTGRAGQRRLPAAPDPRARPQVTLIAANTDIGLLYGAFAWLRDAATGAKLTHPPRPSCNCAC
jgi:alpha-glucuronidase